MKRALALAALVLTAPAVATAQEKNTITRSETIRYASEAADSDQGAQRLYQQMQRSARRVCAVQTRSSSAERIDRDCASKALDRAILNAGKPRLTALHIKRDDDNAILLAERID